MTPLPESPKVPEVSATTSSEPAKSERKIYCEKLETENNDSWRELQQHIPGYRMNVEQAQVGLLVQALVDTHVWTEAQAVEYEITFQETVKETLESAWQAVRNQRSQRTLVKPVQPKKRLILPGE